MNSLDPKSAIMIQPEQGTGRPNPAPEHHKPHQFRANPAPISRIPTGSAQVAPKSNRIGTPEDGAPTHSTEVSGEEGGVGRIGYLGTAVASAAEHDLLEAGGSLDELRERRRQLRRRRWRGGGARGSRGGHPATRPGNGGAVNPNPRLPPPVLARSCFLGGLFGGERERERKRWK